MIVKAVRRFDMLIRSEFASYVFAVISVVGFFLKLYGFGSFWHHVNLFGTCGLIANFRFSCTASEIILFYMMLFSVLVF